jgi:uncharacterized protein YllA (UPF0747 family)
LAQWVALHPSAADVAASGGFVPAQSVTRYRRSAALADRLATLNREWGNNVDAEVGQWLEGADVVVTGQQPGLLGGPLLTLVKACAVVAEVRRSKLAGRKAVGFLWLATADDDLEEMGWGRVVTGEELLEVREETWRRGGALGGAAVVGTGCDELLMRLAGQATGENAREAIELARECYGPGASVGEATGKFLARLFAGAGLVLVDACEAEIGRSAALVVEQVLSNLPRVWEALEDGTATFRARGWAPPLTITPTRLPVFRRVGERRERLAAEAGRCPAGLLADYLSRPEQFLPNAWLRPMVQDTALDTSVAVLGGAELAYHLQTASARDVVGMKRPGWRLRPHVTVVTAAERRLAAQLNVEPHEVLRQRMPAHLLPGRSLRREIARLSSALDRQLERFETRAAAELPGVQGDVEATRRKLDAAVSWLGARVESGALRSAENEARRWKKLRAFLRPRGHPQERDLSVLAPLLRLGVAWPARLSEAIDVADPGMHLLNWGEGGAW